MVLEYVDRCSNVMVVPKEADIYELLACCDLLIAKTSTTVMEAAAFNKPVIVLDLAQSKAVSEYVKRGIALGVYQGGQLRPAIKQLLSDDSPQAACRASYISDYFYKVDGQASARVASLVTGLVSPNKAEGTE